MMRSFVVIGLLFAAAALIGTSRYATGSEASQNPASQVAARPIFVEVPPSESKITWVHDNGHSEARHLPETCGGGGLFFGVLALTSGVRHSGSHRPGTGSLSSAAPCGILACPLFVS